MLSWVALASTASPGIGETIKLNNGVYMPRLAFAAQLWDPATCHDATVAAISQGFRFIWSSVLVGGECQSAQAKAISEAKLPANQTLFVAGTVNTGSCGGDDECYTQTKADAAAQFTTLGVSTLDMIMLDYPSSAGCDGIRGQWRALTELYNAKTVRAVAVSNFSPDDLGCLNARDTPMAAVNQMSYSVGNHGSEVEDDGKLGVVVQAYSPLGSGRLVNDPLLKQIGTYYNKSAAQVALRWILQHNATIATQSTSATHLGEDVNIFDFALSADEMKQLDAH
jgi:diketogulonate reductase-like aldo/keto reductase